MPEGRIDEIYANFALKNRVEFQVWRATGVKDGQSVLIAKYDYETNNTGRVNVSKVICVSINIKLQRSVIECDRPKKEKVKLRNC